MEVASPVREGSRHTRLSGSGPGHINVGDGDVTGAASNRVRLSLSVPGELRDEIGTIDRAEP
jgi:hypothetical protein